jgi:hypothetical protein
MPQLLEFSLLERQNMEYKQANYCYYTKVPSFEVLLVVISFHGGNFN